MAESEFEQNEKGWVLAAFRWAAVLPAAVFCYCNGYLIGATFFLNSGAIVGAVLSESLWQVIGPAFTGFLAAGCFVLVGVKVAPSHKLSVCVSLTVLHSMAMTAFGIFYVPNVNTDIPFWLNDRTPWSVGTYCLVGVATTIRLCIKEAARSRSFVLQ